MKIVKQYPIKINGKETVPNVSERIFTADYQTEVRVTRWKNTPTQIEVSISKYSGKRTQHSCFVLRGEEFKEFSKFLGLEVI